MGLVRDFLNAMVNLDTTVVENLGFAVAESPFLDGAFMVVNNLPPTNRQWLAVAFMAMVLVGTIGTVIVKAAHQEVEVQHHEEDDLHRRLERPPQRRHRFRLILVWSLGLTASCVHNIDNILRPGTYFTPTWIVAPLSQQWGFAMDKGFGLWLLVMLSGVGSLYYNNDNTPGARQLVLIVLHSAGTSFGIMHYMVQSPRQFSAVAHATILWEVVMGVVVGMLLLFPSPFTHSQAEQQQQQQQQQQQPLAPNFVGTMRGRLPVRPTTTKAGGGMDSQHIPPQEEESLLNEAVVVEMMRTTTPLPPGLRQRSKSPQTWK